MNTKRTIAAAGLVLATALGGFIGTADAAPAPKAKTTVGSIAASPSTGLKDLQKVHVVVSGFGTYSGTAHFVQCTASVIQDAAHSAKYCDQKHLGAFKVSHGKGSGYYHVRVAHFHSTDRTQKCVKGGTCLILATTPDHSYAAFSQISFAS